MTHYVYVHRFPKSGDPFYVGKGKGRRAWLKRGRNVYWQRLANKYGFEVEVVAEYDDEKSAMAAEVELIAFLRNEEYRLANIALGGGGITGYRHTKESREKMSIRMKEVCSREEFRQQKANAQRERWNDEAYREHASKKARERWLREDYRKAMAAVADRRNPKEKRERQSEEMKEAWRNEEFRASRSGLNHHAATPVLCVETGVVFPLISDAAGWLRANGVEKAATQAISTVLSGRRETAYGFTWKRIHSA